MTKRILVVEDETNVGSTLVERLRRESYEVSWSKSLEEVRDEIGSRAFDLILLDVGLPDGSGFSVVDAIRAKNRSTAIVFLTAFADPDHRVQGLELGAEDYVTKPFHFKELLLRIQNALRRRDRLREAGDNLRLGKALVHFARYEVESDGVAHPLTEKECALLKLLVDRRGKVVSRDEILDFVWSRDEYPSPRTVDNFVMKLRRLIERDSDHPTLIRSVRGVGYLLAEEAPLGDDR